MNKDRIEYEELIGKWVYKNELTFYIVDAKITSGDYADFVKLGSHIYITFKQIEVFPEYSNSIRITTDNTYYWDPKRANKKAWPIINKKSKTRDLNKIAIKGIFK